MHTSQPASNSSVNASSISPAALRPDANPFFPGVPAHTHAGLATAEALVRNALPLCTYIIRSEGQVSGTAVVQCAAHTEYAVTFCLLIC